jgi:phospholipase C
MASQKQPTSQVMPGFDHLVAVMFENRSFDNLLGYLYSPGKVPEGQTFSGVANGTYSNPGPDGRQVTAHVYQGQTNDIMVSPNPDPGEEYQHVNTQIFGIVDPPGNAIVDAKQMTASFNAPPAGTVPLMNGFVTDYINNFGVTQGRKPTPKEQEVIMGSFSPEMLPVVSTLAREFAVYDHWFSGVPSQTFCNRSFFHASTSAGFVCNDGGVGYKKWMESNTAPTIFNRLEEAGRSWTIYYDESQVISLTGFINGPALRPYWKTNFRGMSQFYEDVATGSLPAYAFIEPRLVFDHNDMHPPVASFPGTDLGAYSDIRAGERLLHDVYSAIRSSAAEQGSNAGNTTLLVTFDEHGGTYDHEPPPSAVPPGPGTPGYESPECGFQFDRLGIRVPAIAISAFTKAGTIIHDEMHHAAVIATLCRKFDLKPLTERDKGAADITNAFNLNGPRDASTWPETVPAPIPLKPQAGHFREATAAMPLTAPGRALLGLLVETFGEPGEKVPETNGEAHEALERLGRGLFG